MKLRTLIFLGGLFGGMNVIKGQAFYGTTGLLHAPTAGYYSYIWAEVLDCDAYEAYKETGDIFNQEVAGKFRKYILTPGCIDDAMDMYVNFRGKEPGIDPLLKNRGLK